METPFFAALVYGLVRIVDAFAKRKASDLLDYNGLDDLSYVGKCEAARTPVVSNQPQTEHVVAAHSYGVS